jgi:hypothetical protein
MTDSRELADQIFAWTEAGVDGVTVAMRLAPYPKSTKREAMRIVREELIPAAVEREVDAEFERRGRYSTEEELAEMAAAGEAKRERSKEAGMARLIEASAVAIKAVVSEHPEALGDGDMVERLFRDRLAKLATQ